VLLDSFPHTMTRLDEFWCEVVSDDGGGCDIEIYHTTRDGNGDPVIDDQLLRQIHDPVELLGWEVGIVLASEGVLPVSAVTISFGNIETAVTRLISSINTDDQVYSLGPMNVHGSGFTDVSAAFVAKSGNRPYPLNIIYKEHSYLEIEPWDIHDTQHYYSTGYTLTLEHPLGDFSANFTLSASADARWVELSGSDGTLMATDAAAVDRDFLEVPASVGNSVLRLSVDGDVEYDEALPPGSTHARWLFSRPRNYTWDSGLVTIDQLPGSIILGGDDLDGLNNSVEAKSVTSTHVLAKQDLAGTATVSQQAISTPGPAITYSTQIFNNAFFAAPFDFVAGYGVGYYPIVANVSGSGEIESPAIVLSHTTLHADDLDAIPALTSGGIVRSDHQLGSTNLAAGGEIEPTTSTFTRVMSPLDLTQLNSVESVSAEVPHVLETISLTQVNTVEDGSLDQVSAFPGEPLDSIGQTQPVTITQSHRVSAATADSTGALQALSVLTEHVLAAQSASSTTWISTPNIVGTERAVIGVGSIESVAIIQTLDPYRYATAMVIGA